MVFSGRNHARLVVARVLPQPARTAALILTDGTSVALPAEFLFCSISLIAATAEVKLVLSIRPD
jgi:hypothetical protein